MALWPNKGEADLRPTLGAPYERTDPIFPLRPMVPHDAPAALRFGPTPLGMPGIRTA